MARPGDLDDVGGDATEAPAPAPEPVQDAPEASAAPEAEASGEGQPEPRPERRDNRPDGYVTKGERDRIANELQQERQQRALYEDRFNKVVERFFSQQEQPAAKPNADDPMPDYQQDPLGWIGWRQRQDQREAEARADQQRQLQAQEEDARKFQDTLSRAKARYQKVIGDRPEVAELYAAVQNHVGNLYAQQGYPGHVIPDLISRYEADVIKWAREEYIPIEEALEQAAAKFGIQVPARQAPQEQRPAPERDPATGQFVSEADRAARQRESQERNASLSSAPGAPVKKMTGTELAKMTEEEMWRQFDSVGRKPGAKQFDRDMGFR